MKKTICIFALLLFVFSGFGQIVDSAVVREVDSLMQLAGQLTEKRAFGQAFEIMVKAETSALESSGKLSALYGNVCFQYGKTHLAKGDYQEAEKRLVQAKTILEKELGPQHVEYAAVLHQLGTVYYFMGNNYEKAELNNLEARKIQEKTPGRESQAYIETTFLLGHIYLYTGNYNQAENHYLETSALQEKLRGKENAFYASILRCMGFVYAKQGKFETAKQYFQANVDIVEKVLGKNSIPYAAGIMSLSWPCMELGELLRAESLLLESKVIFESMANYTEIPSYMSCMEYFGILYNKRGRYDEAEFYHLRSKALRETKLGKDHLSVELSLSYLSDLYWKTGRTEQAAKCFTEGSEMRRKHLANAVRHFSEKELFSFVALFEQALHKHLSFACDFSTKVPPFQGNCFDNVLFYKGFLLNAACQFRNAVHVDTAFAEKFETWKNVRYQLAAAYSQPSSLRENTRITNLETQVNALEKYLANTIVDLNEALGQFGWQEVQAALRPDEAALEFVHFNYYSPGPTDSVMYAALLLRPGMEHPLFIPLFEEKSLAAMLPPFEKNRSEYINKLYEDDAPAKLIWSPLDPHLHGVKTIYSAYSGLLHRLNLVALSAPGKHTNRTEAINNRYNLVILNSTRQLVLKNRTERQAVSGAALFGAIQYELDSTAIPATHPDENANRGVSFAETDSILRDDTWRYLKHSEQETANIAALLQKAGIAASIKTGYDATEEDFKKLGNGAPAPRLLHISTHGYFFPDPVADPQSIGPAVKLSDHPMIRSGLILAGANHAWKTGRPFGNREDGILTAYEISQLDLRNTELVVLSACETGLGHIEGNEGVYGLQRAFKIAGAKTLVMSLWQVPDYQTQELMTAFYQKWLLGKMPVRQALQAAQKEMRDKGYEPFYWAGFVVVE